MALDDFSHVQSASGWRDFPPPTEYVTGELKPLHSFLPALFDKFALRMTIADVCESPIEVDLGVMFLIAFRTIGDDDFQLVPQQVLRSFRYDFAVTHQGKLIGLIECDGKEFHSTTEQIANDRAKDKLAAQIGVRMFRFSGSDIWRDPQGCVRQVL